MINDNYFNTKELRVGTLGIVNYKSSNDIHWNKKKAFPYIIYKKEEREENIIIGTDVFSNNSYYYYMGNNNNTLKKLHGKYTIANNVPLSIFCDEDKMSSSNLLRIISILNISDALLKYRDDDILSRLKKCFEKTTELMDNYETDYYVNKLSYLSEVYINLLMFPNKEFEDDYQSVVLEILEIENDLNKLKEKLKKRRKRK